MESYYFGSPDKEAQTKRLRKKIEEIRIDGLQVFGTRICSLKITEVYPLVPPANYPVELYGYPEGPGAVEKAVRLDVEGARENIPLKERFGDGLEAEIMKALLPVAQIIDYTFELSNIYEQEVVSYHEILMGGIEGWLDRKVKERKVFLYGS